MSSVQWTSAAAVTDLQLFSLCSDHKFLEEQQKQLLAVSQRTMSLPVGR